jgi:hypothetical protein
MADVTSLMTMIAICRKISVNHDDFRFFQPGGLDSCPNDKGRDGPRPDSEDCQHG